MGVSDLDQRKARNDSRDPRQDGCCSPGASIEPSCKEYPAEPLGGHREACRGVDMARFHPQRAFREIHSKETAQKSIEAESGPPVCSLQFAPHVSYEAGRVGLRCLDTCANCRAQLRGYVSSVCSSERRRSSRRSGSAEWAQFWAQRTS